jgi:hypothetical protein
MALLMTGGHTFILIAEGARDNAGTSLVGLRPDVSGYSETPLENFLPQCDTLWHKMFRQVTYTLSVIGTTGTAPTSWSLGARFEQRLSHTLGYQNQFPTWAPLSRRQLGTCLAEGIGWGGETNPASFGVIASSTSVPDFATSGTLPNGLTTTDLPVGGSAPSAMNLITTRVTRSRTVVNQMSGVRIRFAPTITGGDSTTRILLSATATGVR